MTDSTFLDNIRASEKLLSARPELRELVEHITPDYARYWTILGILLGLSSGLLDGIEAGNPKDQFWCCNRMLQEWLNQDTTASWNKIFKSIESRAIYDDRRSHFQSWVSNDNSRNSLDIPCTHRMRTQSDNLHSVVHQVDLLETRLKVFYTKNRYKKSPDEWALHVPDYFTSVTLIHYNNKQTKKEKINIANLLEAGDSSLIDEITNISHIFSSTQLPQVILIEGIAGIGKTILSKEIAYQWATKKILTGKKLLLLVFLRDPGACKVTSIKEFLESYYYQTTKCCEVVSDYLTNMSGKDVTVILDGYDELPKDYREKQSFILDIITGKVLPDCNVVVTSRPIASVSLHSIVHCRIELLGFSKEDRRHYIDTALQNNEDKITTLTEYLEQHSRISTLCYIPLNMSMLVHCFLQTEHAENVEYNLPRTQTDMVNRFVCLCIRRYLLKKTAANFDLNDIKNLDNTHLPDHYAKVIKELTELAYNGLMKDQIVFTDSEVRSTCPELTACSNNWDDLGLLCDIHCTYNSSACIVSYNFVHFSMQEFLAAYHISTLPHDKQLQVLRESFFEKKYFNMWIMFVGLTNGDSMPFRYFLSGSSWPWYSKTLSNNLTVAKSITDDKIKCLYLFQCFMEAQNITMCENIGDVLDSKEIYFSGQTMLATDLGILGFFLKQFDNHQWRLIKLHECQISDAIFYDFCDCICSSSEEYCIIEKLDLSCNLLTTESIAAIIKVIHSCKVQEVNLTANKIYSLSSFKGELILGVQNASLTLVIDNNIVRICNGKNFTDTSKTLLLDREYTDIWMSNCRLGEETNEVFFSALDACESVASVYLANVDLLDSDAKTLINVLKTKTFLSGLCILDTSLSDSIADEIVAEISKGCMLNSSSSMFDSTGQIELLVLSCSKMQIYNLNDEKMIQCLHLSKEISNIKLHNCLIPSKAIKLILKIPLDRLENLDLSGCNIGRQDLSEIINSINNHQRLQVLKLSNNDFTAASVDKLIELVMSLKVLKKLTLSDVALQSDAVYNKFYNLMQSDSAPKCLKELVIGKGFHILSNLDCKDLQEITTSSKTLYMLHCTIERVHHLEKFLHNSNMLCALSIFKCKLNDRVALEVSQLLQHASSLKEISLCLEQLDDAIVYQMISQLSLCIDRSMLVVSESIIHGYQATISQMSNALYHSITCKDIRLDHCQINKDICSALICILSSCTATLEVVDLKDMSIQLNETLQVIDILTHCEKLRVLDIGSLVISYVAVANNVCSIIKKNHATIEQLNISNCNFGTPETKDIKEALTILTALEEITLENCNITHGLASCLASVLAANSKLGVINFQGNNVQATGCIILSQPLMHISTLTVLNFNGNFITDKGAFAVAEIISNNVKLRELHLDSNSLHEAGIVMISASLFKLIGLEVLSLSNNHITHRAALAISTIISKNNLEKLFLNDVKLSTVSMTTLADELKELSSLKLLDIGCNHITDTASGGVASIVSSNFMLESINISGNAFQVDGLKEIFMALSQVKMIKSLDISSNCIVNGLVYHVVSITERNPMLETLLLKDCYLTLTGIVKICQSLSRNSQQLRCISIANNDIDFDATSEIGTVIFNAPKLEKFLASNNIFGSTGISVIGHALCHCSNLNSLDLGNVHMNEIIAETLHDTISKNIFLQKLYLDNCNLSHKCFKLIAESLKKIKTLKVLSFANNNMFSSTSDLASVLQANTLLQELYLQCTNLQANGAIEVLQSLIRLTFLKVLDLSHNSICGKEARELATIVSRNSLLQKLYLQSNQLQSSGVIQIAASISIHKSVKSFNFANNDFTSDACNDLAEIIAKNVNIEEILLSGNKMHSIGISCLLTRLCKNTICLRSLDISNNNNIITDNGTEKLLQVFARQSELEKLCINCYKFQSPSACKLIKSLFNFNSLREIDCGYCNFSFHVFRNFQNMHLGNTCLEVLLLPGNNLMAEGVIILCNLLRYVTTLKHLNLGNNNITDDAAYQLDNLFNCCISLQSIELYSNYLGSTGFTTIAKSLVRICSLRVINFQNNNIDSSAADDLACVIIHNPCLEEVIFGENNLQTDGAIRVFEGLGQINTLRYLDFASNNIQSKAADVLAEVILENKCLKKLRLLNNNFESKGTITIATALQHITTLSVLDLGKNKIDYTAAEAIAGAISNNNTLEELWLFGNCLQTKGAKKIAEALATISTLKVLNLGKNDVRASAAHDIATAVFSNCIEILRLHENYLQTKGVITILSSLQHKSTLRELDISKTYITCDIVNDLIKLLQSNTMLHNLKLGDNACINDCLAEILSSLKRIKTLRQLKLNNYKINDEVAEEVIALITGNHNLEVLSLSKTNMSTESIVTIAGALKSIATLKELDLSHNILNQETIEEMTTVIKRNMTMEVINVSESDLGSAEVVLITQSLKSITTLRVLDLRSNAITDSAVDSIADMLNSNATLEILNLSKNKIKVLGAAILLDKIAKCGAQFMLLDIRDNEINSEEKTEISTRCTCKLRI